MLVRMILVMIYISDSISTMNKAIYIGTIIVHAKKKRDVRTIKREKYPLILDEQGRIPQEDLNRTIGRIVATPMNSRDKPLVKHSELALYSFTYEVKDYVYHSKILNKTS